MDKTKQSRPLISGGSSTQQPKSSISNVQSMEELAIIAKTLKNEEEAKIFIKNLHDTIDSYYQEDAHKNSLMTPLCEIIINFPFGGDVLRELVELVEKLAYFGHEIPKIPEDLLSKLCLNMHSSDTDLRFNFLTKLLKNNRITIIIHKSILQDIIFEMGINSSLGHDYKNEKLDSMILFLNDKLKEY